MGLKRGSSIQSSELPGQVISSSMVVTDPGSGGDMNKSLLLETPTLKEGGKGAPRAPHNGAPPPPPPPAVCCCCCCCCCCDDIAAGMGFTGLGTTLGRAFTGPAVPDRFPSLPPAAAIAAGEGPTTAAAAAAPIPIPAAGGGPPTTAPRIRGVPAGLQLVNCGGGTHPSTP